MKLKISQLILAIQPIQSLNAATIPINISFQLVNLAEDIAKILKQVEGRRKHWYDKLKEPIKITKPKGPKFKVSKKNQKKLDEEMDGIVDEEVEVHVPSLSLEDLKGAAIPAQELRQIKWLISDFPNEKEPNKVELVS